MSERDVQRIEVLSEVVSGRRTIATAAAVLAVTPRHVHRLLRRLQAGGASALAHKARGRPSNNRIAVGLRDEALGLVRDKYADFGPTLAWEMLTQQHGLKVSRETLRMWMVEAGMWLSRKQRRTFHQPACDVSRSANWCRSTAASIAGSRIAPIRARCWCSSMTPRGD